ncbi:MAG: GSCFA domain-containing protein [Oceanococcus sp.]
MSVFRYSYADATSNFHNNRYARWTASEDKVGNKKLMSARVGDVFRPSVQFHTRIPSNASLFTIGSCFARGLERAADRAGMNAKSLKLRPYLDENIKAGFVNRYNTAAILNELRWAAGECKFEPDNLVETKPERFIDPHAHPVLAPMPLEDALRMRQELTRYFAHAFNVDVVTITLGLIEGWFDKHTNQMLNVGPVYGRNDNQGRKLLDGDRFEFRVMSHDENMENLEEIYRLLKRHNPDVKIIISVSPVPLTATFSHRDVAVANMLSKSMLRSCAETWIGNHSDIQYFPSYEMAVMSDPTRVFKEDRVHIQESFVELIMAHFIRNCVDKAAASTQT